MLVKFRFFVREKTTKLLFFKAFLVLTFNSNVKSKFSTKAVRETRLSERITKWSESMREVSRIDFVKNYPEVFKLFNGILILTKKFFPYQKFSLFFWGWFCFDILKAFKSIKILWYFSKFTQIHLEFFLCLIFSN